MPARVLRGRRLVELHGDVAETLLLVVSRSSSCWSEPPAGVDVLANHFACLRVALFASKRAPTGVNMNVFDFHKLAIRYLVHIISPDSVFNPQRHMP